MTYGKGYNKDNHKDSDKSKDKKYYRPMDSYPNKNKDSY